MSRLEEAHATWFSENFFDLDPENSFRAMALRLGNVHFNFWHLGEEAAFP
jgi:hypothetical protein